MEGMKTWWQKRGWLAVIGGAVLLLIISNAIGTKGTGTLSDSTTASNNNDLKVGIIPASDGLAVTNEEGEDWTNCMVGLNGGTGWGFDNPPYQTRSNLTLSGNKMTTVPFKKITSEDGTIFDPSTHAINTVVVECFRGTTDIRSWVGTSNS